MLKLQSNTESRRCGVCKPNAFSLASTHEDGCLQCTCMGITDVCTQATFNTVKIPAPVYAYRLALKMLDETGQPTGLQATVNRQQKMAEVVIPDGRSAYWNVDSFSDKPNQLELYGGTVHFAVQWESNVTNSTSAVIDSTKVILIGRQNTVLWFRVAPATLAEKSTATLGAEFSVENVVAMNGTKGRATRQLMMLVLSDVKRLLLPASLHTQPHISRLSVH